jgi:hypothetical protein
VLLDVIFDFQDARGHRAIINRKGIQELGRVIHIAFPNEGAKAYANS